MWYIGILHCCYSGPWTKNKKEVVVVLLVDVWCSWWFHQCIEKCFCIWQAKRFFAKIFKRSLLKICPCGLIKIAELIILKNRKKNVENTSILKNISPILNDPIVVSHGMKQQVFINMTTIILPSLNWTLKMIYEPVKLDGSAYNSNLGSYVFFKS